MSTLALRAFAPLALITTFFACSSNGSSSGGSDADAGGPATPDEAGSDASGPATLDGGPLTPYAIGGNVLGLSGSGLVIQNNGGDDLAISHSGPFVFPVKVLDTNTYYVRVTQQPTSPDQLCLPSTNIGSVHGADVTDVFVQCSNAYLITVTVSGLTGTGLMLYDNGADLLTVTTNGPATFSQRVGTGQPYTVSVAQQPTGQTCVVGSGTGVVAGADVSTPTVACN